MLTASFHAAQQRPRARPHRAASSALVCALASLAAPAQAALSLDQALLLAEQRSFQLVAQDAAATAARALAVAAAQLPDPTLKAGVNNLPVNGPDKFSLTADFMTMSSIGVMQELTTPGKRRARAARFEREADAAQTGRTVALAALRRDTALAWLTRYYQEQTLDLLRAQRAEAGLQIEATDAAYRAGRATQAELFGARSAAAQIDDRIRQAERQVAVAKTKLARWVGDDAGQALGAPPSLAELGFAAGELEARLAHHPQLAMMTRLEQVAQAEADIARSNKQADWSVELVYSQRGPAYSNMVSFNVSIPLQLDQARRQDRDLAARLAFAEQLRAQREEAAREQAADARSALQEWQGNRERLAQYDSTLVPLAAERTRAAIAGYRGGAGPLAAALEARRFEIETRVERLRLEMETAALWAQLEYLIPPAQDRQSAVTEK